MVKKAKDHSLVESAEYLVTNVDWEKCPPPEKPEYAFIGRSNVGKSSLINMITNRKNLALTSSKPGKTRTINHFIINNNWYLVDLPGYGYAAFSKTNREKWMEMVRDYLTYRLNLGCVFVLIDASIPPQKIDLEFVQWLGEQGIAFAIIFTKTDKEKAIKIKHNINAFKNKMLEAWESLPRVFITSAEKKEGREELFGFITEMNKLFKP